MTLSREHSLSLRVVEPTLQSFWNIDKSIVLLDPFPCMCPLSMYQPFFVDSAFSPGQSTIPTLLHMNIAGLLDGLIDRAGFTGEPESS